ncbi:DNA-processing protein DprA [Luedemannella helvata]|uniref:DNA-processing protein DprA n=1 Tax=Luedemannella helvata TaxID=349315 RepID=UPI0031D59A63
MSDVMIERAAVVALLRSPGASWSHVAAEVLDRGSAVSLLREPSGQQDILADPDAALEDAVAEVRAWESAGIGVHCVLDASYPALLRDIRERPPLLFSRGQLADDVRAIAVVGSRAASDRACDIAGAIAAELVARRVTIVSGLAAGIDTAAHHGALAAGGRTVAVIGTGVDQTYPSTNRPLQQRIATEGLVLSQFWPDAPPRREHFPMRNAVMSGYSAATVVVEAGEHSGVRIQARLALQHGRQVIVRKELLELEWVRHLATRPGVHVSASLEELVNAVDDVLRQRDVLLSGREGIAGLFS